MRFTLLLTAMTIVCSVGTLSAAALDVRVSMKGGTENTSHVLAGANIQLSVRWDPSAATPLTIVSGDYRGAVWTPANMTITMNVMGSAGNDGHYVGQLSPSPTAGWFLTNNHPTYGDSIHWPHIAFQVGSEKISFPSFRAHFDANYFSGTVMPTPGPFSPSEVTWPAVGILSESPYIYISASNISGAATYVPEPNSIAMAGLWMLPAFAALCRRK